MKRVGLDTSVVLRLLVGLPEAQARAAVTRLDDLLQKRISVAVSDLVVAETYFALCFHYKVPKQGALNTLKLFLESSEISGTGAALSVLQQPHLGRANPGFVDRLIHADYLGDGGSMLSFEKAAGKLTSAEVLKAKG